MEVISLEIPSQTEKNTATSEIKEVKKQGTLVIFCTVSYKKIIECSVADAAICA